MEQVTNVVLYSSDFYTKVVAAEEAQWVNAPALHTLLITLSISNEMFS